MTMIIGVDPGPIPGICSYRWDGEEITGVRVFQCNHEALPLALGGLMLSRRSGPVTSRMERVVLCCEEFVVRGRSGRSAHPEAGNCTRRMIGQLEEIARELDLEFHTHTASDVKQWATDRRLRAAGLYTCTEGMRHARDGARHALWGGVKHAGVTDPFSIKAVR